MDYAALRADILTGPLAAQCAPYVILPDEPKDPDYAAKDQAVADLLNAGTQTAVRPLRVEEVFDVLFTSGDWVSIETARLGGNQTAVLCQAVLSSAKSLGPGLVDLEAPATIALLDQLQQAALLSQTGRDALATRMICKDLRISHPQSQPQITSDKQWGITVYILCKINL